MRVALVLLLGAAACGDGIGAPADAVGLDAATEGLVRIQYTPPEGEIVTTAGGLPVIFQRPDGSIALATRTLEDGTASAFVPAGSSVTLAASQGDLYTYLDVQPGDELFVGTAPPAREQINFNVQAPTAPDAGSYWIYSSCDRGFPTFAEGVNSPFGVTIPLSRCDDGVADLLLVSRKEFVDTPDQYIFVPGATIQQSSGVEFPGPYAAAGRTVKISNVSVFIGFVEVRQIVSGRRVVFDTITYGNNLIHAASGGGEVVTPLPVPAGTVIETQLYDLGTFRRTGLMNVIAWAPAGPAIDVDFTDLPDALVRLPAYNAERHEVRWLTARDGLIPETVQLTLLSSRGRWQLSGPFRSNGDGDAFVELPVLPQAVFPDPEEGFGSIDLIMLSGAGSARTHLLAWSPGQPWPVSRSSGRVVYQTVNHDL